MSNLPIDLFLDLAQQSRVKRLSAQIARHDTPWWRWRRRAELRKQINAQEFQLRAAEGAVVNELLCRREGVHPDRVVG